MLLSRETLPLTLWHRRLGHLNFPDLRAYLKHLEISYFDNSENHICESCLRLKATKRYNRNPQERAGEIYQFVHTDLVGPITPLGFGGKRYFVTFTDDATRYTEIFTCAEKKE